VCYASLNILYVGFVTVKSGILTLFAAFQGNKTHFNGTMKKIRVLFVCLGNICRSPLAEAIFMNQIRSKGLEAFIEADSCGTSNYHIGGSPDPRTIENAIRNGVTIEHCGRQLSDEDLERFDFILAMDRSNFQNILQLPGSKTFSHKVKMMRDFDPVRQGDVPDPYFGGEQGFQEVFEILDRAIANFIAQLETEVGPRNPTK
jgi:protein-tyrosine phosphatase